MGFELTEEKWVAYEPASFGINEVTTGRCASCDERYPIGQLGEKTNRCPKCRPPRGTVEACDECRRQRVRCPHGPRIE